ncbi:MAG: VCBS repeat-containing protein [Bacteroidota bacterium]
MDHRSYKTVAIFAGLYWLSVFIAGCKTDKKLPAMFEVLDSKRTGLSFSNDLSYNKDFNLFKYIYFYNGSGAGAGDFNNDGLIDLFFGSNQHDNKLYLNAGDLNFRDVTKDAGIPGDGGWTTGISVVDINNDGLLDIYVCRVGQYETLKSKNQLLICQGIDQKGIPSYKDMSHEYGLDFPASARRRHFLIMIWMAIWICSC